MQEDTYYGDGLNLYVYCQNNPLTYIDPTGHSGHICDKKYNELKNKGPKKLSPKEKEQIERYERDKAKREQKEAAKKKRSEERELKKKERAEGKGNKRTEEQRKKWREYTGEDPTGEVHHGLPEELKDWFEDEELRPGLDINSGEFYYDLPTGKHRLKDENGIHTNNSPLGKDWNEVWKDYKRANPDATIEDIMAQLKAMEDATGIGQYRAVKKED